MAPERLRLDLEAYRQQLGDCPIAVALRPSPPDRLDPRTWPRRCGSHTTSVIGRVDFYHYGFVRSTLLDWIRAAVDARPVDRRASGEE